MLHFPALFYKIKIWTVKEREYGLQKDIAELDDNLGYE